ncbi:FAD-dependent oxidoreductase [Streptococcus ferus]|uniref:FAD-dependent oxidoreductase n=1 Tax=Streptococcus ferus TaxID=1345 RepID=UPI00359F5146
MTKIIIVGGVAGGMSAATRLRRLMEEADIIVFDKGPYVSFANCGLPFHVSGEIEERSSLLVQTPEALKARFNLDIRPETEVLRIDKDKKEVVVKSSDKSYRESYDYLILSPGAKPFVPDLPGLDEATNVFTLRNIPDLDQIMEKLEQSPAKATVIGAGFIGLEMAESLVKRGLEVTIVEKASHVLPPLDEEMASFVQGELQKKGIRLYTNQSVQVFQNGGKTIVLEDGSQLETDLTLMSIGVQPESSLAEEAGLALGFRNGIIVNDTYQTSHPDIYAVGDAILVRQEITGEDVLISLASPANRQGRQVADVIAGLERSNKGSIGTAIVRIFDLVAASTGLNERLARQKFLDVAVVHTIGKHHAGYYPGASDLILKLIFNSKTGRLYGAQAIGQKGVDKRIDVLATAMKAGLTIFDLPELEFTYAPPFGAAKDPVNMIGYAAINIAEGISETVQWYELEDELAQGAVLLDVRTAGELSKGYFPEALSIPLDELRSRIEELDPSRRYIVSCHSGLRSYLAERLLKQHGFQVKNLDGAYQLYQAVRPERIKHG